MRVALLHVLIALGAGCGFEHGVLGGTASGDGGDGNTDPTVDARMHPAAGPCGKPGVIADDFADGVASTRWRVANAADVVESGGELAITPTMTSRSGYTSIGMVDLRDAADEVEVRSMVTGAGATAYFVASNRGQLFGFQAHDGMLTAQAGAVTVTVPFDPVAHRWWRMTVSGSTLSLQTSPSGAVWTSLVDTPAPPWVAAVAITLAATNPSVDPAPGTVRFAQHSTYVPSATWCAANTLSDGFDDSVIGVIWSKHDHTSTGCLEYETAGLAHFDQYGTTCDAFYGSSAFYSLAGSEVVTRITAITTYANGWFTYLAAVDATNQFVRLAFDQNQMCADGTGLTRTCVAYMTNEDLWRIRESGGTLVFEVAQGPTPATWRTVNTVATPFDLSAVDVFVGTVTNRNINQSIGLGVDRVN